MTQYQVVFKNYQGNFRTSLTVEANNVNDARKLATEKKKQVFYKYFIDKYVICNVIDLETNKEYY